MSSLLMKVMIVWAAFIVMLEILGALETDSPVVRALLSMSLGLALLWVVVVGTISWRLRGRIRARVLRIPLGWRLKFVLFAVLLAMLEEAITVGMTNLAPLFGVQVGAAYITASANYFDVILFHSVIVFVPMFIAWAWLLGRRDFSPNAVFLLFGVTGTLAETFSFGVQNLVSLGFWVCVYGLMVYLPAYTLPSADGRGVSKPRLLDYPLALLLPFALAVPVAILVGVIHPTFIHFPPLTP
jgi:hypothetical protein